jgi:hypothetical protein
MTLRKPAAALGLALALGLGTPASAPACPNCKEAIASQNPEEAQRLKTGYFYSILLMIAMPATLLGTGAFVIGRAVKRGALPEM